MCAYVFVSVYGSEKYGLAVVNSHFLGGRQCAFQENEVYTSKEATEIEKIKAEVADHSHSLTHIHKQSVCERDREKEREEERALKNEFLIPFIHERLLQLPVLWIFNSSFIYAMYTSIR